MLHPLNAYFSQRKKENWSERKTSEEVALCGGKMYCFMSPEKFEASVFLTGSQLICD